MSFSFFKGETSGPPFCYPLTLKTGQDDFAHCLRAYAKPAPKVYDAPYEEPFYNPGLPRYARNDNAGRCFMASLLTSMTLNCRTYARNDCEEGTSQPLSSRGESIGPTW